MKHQCSHEDIGSCFKCSHPMTSMKVSTIHGFNKLVNNISKPTFKTTANTEIVERFAVIGS